MKKVLFVATVLRGHVLVFHLPYMQWFQRQGYEVHLCCRNDTGEPVGEIPGCDRFIELPFERSPFSRGNLPVYRRLKALIDAEGYALIHCNTPVGGMLGRLCARDARKRGAKVVYTAHGFHFFTGAPLKNWLFFYPAERFLSRYTDLLVTINGEDYRRAQRFHAKHAVQVCGVGVAVERFSAPVDVAGVRAGLGFTMEDRLVICVGEHSRRKNHQTALRAMTLVARAHLLLCGVGEEKKTCAAWPWSWVSSGARTFWASATMCRRCWALRTCFCFPPTRRGFPCRKWRPWPRDCPAWSATCAATAT